MATSVHGGAWKRDDAIFLILKSFGIVGQRHFESSFTKVIHGRKPSRSPLLKQFLATINFCYHHQT
jgi:hypothetical protein